MNFNEISIHSACFCKEFVVSLSSSKQLIMRGKGIRPYNKSELAQAYAPDITPNAALNRLALWIKSNGPLFKALHECGYSTNQRVFTSRQVALIFEYLGEP